MINLSRALFETIEGKMFYLIDVKVKSYKNAEKNDKLMLLGVRFVQGD